MQDPSKPIWVKPKVESNSTLPCIYLATPVHSECSIHYTQALLSFQQACLSKGILVSFALLKSSLVTQGRNFMLYLTFMELSDTYSLFFIY